MMARQDGVLPLVGRIGNLTFYKQGGGYAVRKVTGISKERMESDPAFARTRENFAEFASAAKAGKLLRTALKEVIFCPDTYMSTRLNSFMLDAIKLDLTSNRGKRNVLDGELAILNGFEFNLNGTLVNVLAVNPVGTINRVSGECIVSVASFLPEKNLKAAESSTHYRFIIAAAAIDFESGTKDTSVIYGDYIPLVKNQLTDPVEMTVSVGANSTHPIFLAVAIEFVQEMNGSYYSLQNGANNPCALVKIDTGV